VEQPVKDFYRSGQLTWFILGITTGLLIAEWMVVTR
jgi:hypothetical protein